MEYLPIPLIDDLKYIIYQYAYDEKEQYKKIHGELIKLFYRKLNIYLHGGTGITMNYKMYKKHLSESFDTYYSFTESIFNKSEWDDFHESLKNNLLHYKCDINEDDEGLVSCYKYINNYVDIKCVYRKKRRWKFYIICYNPKLTGDDNKNPFILDTRAKTLRCTHTKRTYTENYFKIQKNPFYTRLPISKRLYEKHKVNIIVSDNFINVLGLTKKHVNLLREYI